MAYSTIPGAGAKLRGSVLSTLINEVRTLSGLATVQTIKNNNTTLGDVTGMGVSVLANATYELRCSIRYTTNSTADIKFGWTFPVGLTMIYGGVGYSTAEVLTTFHGQDQTTTPALGGVAAAAVLFAGRVIVGANAGTLQLQMAQNTANVSNTIVEPGSLLTLTRIS